MFSSETRKARIRMVRMRLNKAKDGLINFGKKPVKNSRMPVIVIDEHIPFIKGVFEPFARVIYVKGSQIDRNLALKADGLIIRTRTRCDAQLLEGTPVKFIATATIGTDHIDTDFCDRNGIKWHHAPGCNSSSVSQYIASSLVNLALKHRFNLAGKKIGIIGVGHVGSKVAKLAEALGMIPLLNDPPRARDEKAGNFMPLEEVLETCELITLHVPLTTQGYDKTYGLVNSHFIEKLQHKPILINTSRGDVVDTHTVKNALITGEITGYAADVWENEPAVDKEIINLSDIATPHIAGYSVEGKANGTAACVQSASRFFGFGLDPWYPTSLPNPENQIITIDPTGKSEEQIIIESILSAYDIMRDDTAFREEISAFESLRNFYPVRREFSAFTLSITSINSSLIARLESIGFNFHR
jgi:erythronate-4-phosphate dehydrogenase